jgi:integrase
MKGKGSHTSRRLNDRLIKSLKKPGTYTDGQGLYLRVFPNNRKLWINRITVRKKRRDFGLGSYPAVSLHEARERAADNLKQARAGFDPRHKSCAASVPSFRDLALEVAANRKGGWKNAKHSKQWLSSLERHVFAKLGDLPVNQVDSALVLSTLAPIWQRKPETARRLRQRIFLILDWAATKKWRDPNNWVLKKEVSTALGQNNRKPKHFKALDYDQVPDFLLRLHGMPYSEITKAALEFLILTACRTNEVINARWDEIDLTKRLWTIPAERMKKGEIHRVPLSSRCIEILMNVRELFPHSDFIFPGQEADRPISNMALLMILRRMKVNATVHGFRSSFRDFASEETGAPHHVCEMALAHAITNQAEKAYRRGELLEKRRELMETWCEFVTLGAKPQALKSSSPLQLQ